MTITYSEDGFYYCQVCGRNFNTDDDDDIHTEPASGGDCCAGCCPVCNCKDSDR